MKLVKRLFYLTDIPEVCISSVDQAIELDSRVTRRYKRYFDIQFQNTGEACRVSGYRYLTNAELVILDKLKKIKTPKTVKEFGALMEFCFGRSLGFWAEVLFSDSDVAEGCRYQIEGHHRDYGYTVRCGLCTQLLGFELGAYDYEGYVFKKIFGKLDCGGIGAANYGSTYFLSKVQGKRVVKLIERLMHG